MARGSLVLVFSLFCALPFSCSTGRWSWAIHALAHGVYTFGFVLMTPQLFINYKLKSVAHLYGNFDIIILTISRVFLRSMSPVLMNLMGGGGGQARCMVY